ncbi:uncharacterized protein B0J16DRAFT_338868 [Fusarium flagelliforme]|uniref:uncharacterized protein n=1 Tax=Fusarium flagelliforme TaxID=2675880 RepID=UPI001E8D740B|nr:uncharacterized protein B0J16DRAFT_338868 [Fusarium flagelliforme]KAH7189124.1 hypothetical protein B0J16DRAFT_338868 [Fusarium flagelliforme]
MARKARTKWILPIGSLLPLGLACSCHCPSNMSDYGESSVANAARPDAWSFFRLPAAYKPNTNAYVRPPNLPINKRL